MPSYIENYKNNKSLQKYTFISKIITYLQASIYKALDFNNIILCEAMADILYYFYNFEESRIKFLY